MVRAQVRAFAGTLSWEDRTWSSEPFRVRTAPDGSTARRPHQRVDRPWSPCSRLHFEPCHYPLPPGLCANRTFSTTALSARLSCHTEIAALFHRRRSCPLASPHHFPDPFPPIRCSLARLLSRPSPQLIEPLLHRATQHSATHCLQVHILDQGSRSRAPQSYRFRWR